MTTRRSFVGFFRFVSAVYCGFNQDHEAVGNTLPPENFAVTPNRVIGLSVL
jgi:hypothetical protein